ncbi:MAG: response regulator [Puniceicoccaceae bacterium]
MSKPIQIMLIEDHMGYREVIERAVKREPGMELTSQFGTAEIALRSLQDTSKPPSPNLILLDLNLPGMSGLEALPWIKQYSPNSEVIVLTQSDRESDVLQAISLGASGYLLKSSTVRQITAAIHTVMEGGATIDPNVARYILDTVKNIKPKEEPEKHLSDREREILTLLADGLVKKEIADKLEISVTTVAYHVKHIYEKLNVQNAPAAVAKAFRMGMFSSN